jgi:hypothetical protein
MKIVVAMVAALAVTSVAFAQSPQPPADQPSQEQSPPPPASAPPPVPRPPRAAAPSSPPPGAQMPHRTVNDCREQARAQGIAREQRKEFMQNCRRQVADACRNDARAQRMSRDERRDFMRNCMGTQARGPKGNGGRPPQYGVPPDDGEPMDDDDGAPPPRQ